MIWEGPTQKRLIRFGSTVWTDCDFASADDNVPPASNTGDIDSPGLRQNVSTSPKWNSYQSIWVEGVKRLANTRDALRMAAAQYARLNPENLKVFMW
jgi:hypothetical protein